MRNRQTLPVTNWQQWYYKRSVSPMSATDHNGLSLNDLVMVEIKDKKWTIIK